MTIYKCAVFSAIEKNKINQTSSLKSEKPFITNIFFYVLYMNITDTVQQQQSGET